MRNEQPIERPLRFIPEPLLLGNASERFAERSTQFEGNAAMNGTVGETA